MTIEQYKEQFRDILPSDLSDEEFETMFKRANSAFAGAFIRDQEFRADLNEIAARYDAVEADTTYGITVLAEALSHATLTEGGRWTDPFNPADRHPEAALTLDMGVLWDHVRDTLVSPRDAVIEALEDEINALMPDAEKWRGLMNPASRVVVDAKGRLAVRDQ